MPDIPWDTFSIILLIFVVAGTTQGVMGFGFGIVAMTLLPLTMGLKDAITLLAIMNAIIMSLSLFWHKSSFQWSEARKLLIGAGVGIPIGVYIVAVLPERILIIILGASMLFVGINYFLTRHRKARPRIEIAEYPIGMFAGILAAGFNMGGPPVVAYAYSRTWTAEQTKAVLASIFMVTAVSRLFFIGYTGEDLNLIFSLTAILVIPIAIILRIGISLGRKVPHEFLRPIVFAYLSIVGLYYVFWHA
jgi:uncharacterized membrane protein YfcA